jgi:hypothetical protein
MLALPGSVETDKVKCFDRGLPDNVVQEHWFAPK